MGTSHHIWQYWSGPKPEHIRICEESLDRRLGKWTLVRLNDRSARKRFPGMHQNWERMRWAAQKADYLKAYALTDVGGLWIDSDIAIVGSLDECWNMIRKQGLCFCGEPGLVFEGFIGSAAHHKFAKDWLRRCNTILGRRITFEWARLGSKTVRPLSTQYRKVTYLDRDRILPLRGHRRKVLGWKRDLSYIVKENAIGVHLFNKEWGQHWQGMKREGLLAGPTIGAQLFRRALGMQ